MCIRDRLKTIGGLAFGLMLPVLAGYIGEAIGDRPALAVGFVGGVIAANGKSGFLGALVAGFVSGYLILLLRKPVSYTHLKLDEEVVDPDDVEMLEDLLVAAVNEALEKVDAETTSAMSKFTGGMGGGMPGLF